MLKFWDFANTMCIGFGLVALIPIDSSGSLMIPLPVALSMIGGGIVSELLLLGFRNIVSK